MDTKNKIYRANLTLFVLGLKLDISYQGGKKPGVQ